MNSNDLKAPRDLRREPPVRAAIYARISRDKAGEGLGVDRQETDCRALAERLGWDVVAVYVDNDISAYSGRRRPQYQEMLREVRAGRINGVVAWHTDRLHRRATELEEFVKLADEAKLQIQTVTAGNVDLSTPSGRMVARMLGAAAQHEVDHARERVKRAKEQLALNGEFRGGQRPFGYDKDGMTLRPDEAKVIRDCTNAVLAGRSLASLSRELNEAGIVTAKGKQWSYVKLREVLARPRNAALISKGRSSSRDVEIVGPAKWPAIVDEETWRALHTMLTQPSRRSGTTTEVRWLGSGIYRCGKCGGAMRPAPIGGTDSRNGPRRHIYRCSEKSHMSVMTEYVDDYVRSVVAELVRDPRVIAAMSGDDNAELSEARARRSALAIRLETFENDYATGAITGAQLRKATEVVNAEIADLDEQLSQGIRKTASSPVASAVDPGQEFLDSPIDIQRAVVSTVITVTINASPYRGAKWTTDRVVIKPVES